MDACDDDCAKPLKRARAEDDGLETGAMEASMIVDGVEMKLKRGGTQPPPAPPKEPVSVAELAKQHGFGDEACWGCAHLTKPARKDDDIPIWQLLDYCARNQFSMSEKIFAEQLHKLHNKLVVEPLRLEGRPVFEWPVHLIRVHFSSHGATKRTIHMRQLQKYNTLNNELDLRVCSKDASGRVEPDYLAMKEMRENTKIIHMLLHTDMEKLAE